jgi:tetraacyldisaccharide 4'-kinase
MRQLTAILKVGDGHAADAIVRMTARVGKAVYVAAIKPKPQPDLAGRRVLAYAGIADPAKFYRTVQSLGADIVVQRSFSDHHHFSEDEVADLLETASKENLLLVTTAKDAVRLGGHHGRAEALRRESRVVDIDMVFDDPHAASTIIDTAIENCRTRRLHEEAVKRI